MNALKTLLFAAGIAALAADSSFAADWIWSSSKPQHGETAWFRHEFNLEKPGEGTLTITADNSYALYINGSLAGLQRLTEDWSEPDEYHLVRVLRPGKNSIAVRAINDEGEAAVMVSLKVKDGDKDVVIASGSDWQARRNLQPKWSALDAHGGGWGNAHSFGEAGTAEPWGALKPAKKVESGLIEFQQFRERDANPFELIDGDRVVLLGGTFFERAQRYGWLEAAMQARFPDRQFTVRNLAWSADTVWADSRGIFDTPEIGYAQMIEQVRELRPTVILLNYGANESFEGKAGLAEFIAGYEQLLNDLSVTGASKVLLSPHLLLKLAPPLPDPAAQNKRLAEYTRAIQKLAKDRHLHFANLLATGMRRPLTPKHSDAGLHFNEAGYRQVSQGVVDAVFGYGPREASTTIDATAQKATESKGCSVSGIKMSPKSIEFRVTFEPGYVGDLTLRGQGFLKGTYEILVNGSPAGRISTERPSFTGVTIPLGSRLDKLREAIVRKNELYFYSWRPQNITYLFLFRKHEQGNNAKEVEEFRPLVEKLEAEIAATKKHSGTIHVELVRVN
jgi:lysophospholipase L1-like esterase